MGNFTKLVRLCFSFAKLARLFLLASRKEAPNALALFPNLSQKLHMTLHHTNQLIPRTKIFDYYRQDLSDWPRIDSTLLGSDTQTLELVALPQADTCLRTVNANG